MRVKIVTFIGRYSNNWYIVLIISDYTGLIFTKFSELVEV